MGGDQPLRPAKTRQPAAPFRNPAHYLLPEARYLVFQLQQAKSNRGILRVPSSMLAAAHAPSPPVAAASRSPISRLSDDPKILSASRYVSPSLTHLC